MSLTEFITLTQRGGGVWFVICNSWMEWLSRGGNSQALPDGLTSTTRRFLAILISMASMAWHWSWINHCRKLPECFWILANGVLLLHLHQWVPYPADSERQSTRPYMGQWEASGPCLTLPMSHCYRSPIIKVMCYKHCFSIFYLKVQK